MISEKGEDVFVCVLSILSNIEDAHFSILLLPFTSSTCYATCVFAHVQLSKGVAIINAFFVANNWKNSLFDLFCKKPINDYYAKQEQISPLPIIIIKLGNFSGKKFRQTTYFSKLKITLNLRSGHH